MILDSSAVVAILLKEPGFEALLERLAVERKLGIGTPTLAEVGIVLRFRLGFDPRGLLGRFLQEFAVATVPFGERHWRTAVEAFGRFGKGLHPAGLNFGDCMTYAVAKLAVQPLLATGNDFSKTDLELA